MNEVDVYPVGLLRDLIKRQPMYGLKYLLAKVWEGNWRAVRNYFNGYLAEPAEWPEGVTKCGRGWTQRAALRDWNRKAERYLRGMQP